MESPIDQRIQRVVVFVLDNIADIITIIVAFYLVIRHQFSPFEIDDLAVSILALLAMIAFSAVWQEHRQVRSMKGAILETQDMVANWTDGKAQAEDFFWGNDVKVKTKDIVQANEIYIVGMTLNRTVREHMATLGNKLEDGANIRLVVLDCENDALMEILPSRSFGARSKDWWQARVRQTEGHIEDIPNSIDSSGNLKVGYVSFPPSFGMLLIDPDKSHGEIHVEIYHHMSAEPNPTFTLRAADDAYWYSFFKKQFDLLWQSCESGAGVKEINYLGP